LNLLLVSIALFNAATALDNDRKIELGTAGDYTILTKSGISTVPESFITGNIAVSPIAATAITGFGLALDSDGQFSTATQVIGDGKVFAASYGGVTAKALIVAVGDMEIAYADAAGRANVDAERINVGGGAIGGLTLTPGVYTFQTGISIGPGTDVTFDAKNNADAVFILQTTGTLLQAAKTNVILKNDAQAKNIFWQVAGNVLVGVEATLAGVLLVKTDVTLMTGSFLNGRVLAQTACTLQKATIKQDAGTGTTPAASKGQASATATVTVIATTVDPFTGTTTENTTIITQTTSVTASETKRTTRKTHITTATVLGARLTSTDIDPEIVEVSAGSGVAAPAATATVVAVEGKAPFLASATATATATSSLAGLAGATAEATSIAGPVSTASSTATTTATRTTTTARALADATKEADRDTLPTATATTTGTTEAISEALATKTATSTATATFTEA
jgi:hypothetical protein